jgi:hypothetical protein
VRSHSFQTRFDFERIDIKATFAEYEATEARLRELREQGGIQRQVCVAPLLLSGLQGAAEGQLRW